CALETLVMAPLNMVMVMTMVTTLAACILTGKHAAAASRCPRLSLCRCDRLSGRGCLDCPPQSRPRPVSLALCSRCEALWRGRSEIEAVCGQLEVVGLSPIARVPARFGSLSLHAVGFVAAVFAVGDEVATK